MTQPTGFRIPPPPPELAEEIKAAQAKRQAAIKARADLAEKRLRAAGLL